MTFFCVLRIFWVLIDLRLREGYSSDALGRFFFYAVHIHEAALRLALHFSKNSSEGSAQKIHACACIKGGAVLLPYISLWRFHMLRCYPDDSIEGLLIHIFITQDLYTFESCAL